VKSHPLHAENQNIHSSRYLKTNPKLNRALKNKHQAGSQGERRFGKRSLLSDRWAFTKAAQRWITALGVVFQHP
jgi:hypothetical protein